MSAVLDRYMTELQAYALLDKRQERALAQEIEALVVEHWRALVSYGPALDVIERAVHAATETHTRVLAPLRASSKASSRAPAAAACSAAAKRLHRLDKDAEALKAADGAVREAFAEDGRAQRYLARVAIARGAQLRAKSRFVAANLRLVIALARRYNHGLMPLDDLVQEGNLGLMRAVERFDHRRGFRFSTYAAWWIRHGLNRALSDKARLVRVPVHALDDYAKVGRAIDAAEMRAGKPPSNEEICAATGLTPDKLLILRSHVRLAEPMSLDRELRHDSDQTMHDILPGPEQPDADRAIDFGTQRAQLERLMTGLSSIEATTLRLRFGLGGSDELTLREIGLKYNLSRERIRQIEGDALRKLRRAMSAEQPGNDDGQQKSLSAAC